MKVKDGANMRKRSFVIIAFLLLLTTIISLSLYSIKFSSASSCVDDTPLLNKTDFDSLNYMDTFDVSDFSGSTVNTIDIPSKEYISNVITVRDSDFQISDELLDQVYGIINSYGASNSFYIVSLEDGMSVGYNVDRAYETASSIKAPFALYVSQEVAKGNIDPEQKIVYKERFYNPGTGIIKRSSFGTEYSVRQLLYYTIHESDNIAHEMLHKTFGVGGYNQMLKNLGTKQLYLTSGNPWGFMSPRSSAIIWQEIYNYAILESEGVNFLNILSNAKYNYFKEVFPNIESASKTGFAKKDVVETGIVFGERPYIAICVANKGGNIGAYTQVVKLIKAMNDIMTEYNKFMDNK